MPRIAFALLALALALGLSLGLSFGMAAPAAAQSQTLRIAGSGSMSRMLEALGARLAERQSGVKVVVASGGSATGPPALRRGDADLASLTRPLEENEQTALRRGDHVVRGYAIAVDAVAVFVNDSNPIRGLSLPELDAIFSTTRACGAEKAVRTWGGLGLAGEWADRQIGAYVGRPTSGTRHFFRNVALCGGRFADHVRTQPGMRSAALAVADSRYGITYGSRTVREAGIRIVPVASRSGQPHALPDPAQVYEGRYPLARELFLFARVPEDEALPAPTRDFLALVLSAEGQALVAEAGFLPLPKARMESQARELAAD